MAPRFQRRRTFAVALGCLTLLLESQSVAGKMIQSTEEMMAELIDSASRQRIQNAPADTSPDCQWPFCAARCLPCDIDPTGSCKLPSWASPGCSFQEKCILGQCFCRAGYCSNAGGCSELTCIMGAVPPTNVISPWAEIFSAVGPQVPASNAGTEEWSEFLSKAMLTPLLLFLLGVVMALGVVVCLKFHMEFEVFQRKRPGPCLMVTLSICTILLMTIGIVSRQQSVGQSMELADLTLSSLSNVLEEADQVAVAMNSTRTRFEVQINSVPGSCTTMFGMAFSKNAMNKIVDVINTKLTKFKRYETLYEETVHTMHRYVALLASRLDHIQTIGVWAPSVPIVFMIGSCVVLLLAALISWFSKDPTAATNADWLLMNFGSCWFALLIIVSVGMCSCFLYTAITTAGYCQEIDLNTVSFLEQVNFTHIATKMNHKIQWDLNPLVYGAAQYYLLGTRENPLDVLLNDMDRTVESLGDVYNASQWAVGPAKLLCPELTKLDTASVVAESKRSIGWMKAKLHASYVWPYWDDLAHELVCRRTLTSFGTMISVNLFVSLVCFPMMALVADVEFRRWSNHKDQNFEQHFYGDGGYEDSDEMGDHCGDHQLGWTGQDKDFNYGRGPKHQDYGYGVPNQGPYDYNYNQQDRGRY